MPPPGIPVTEPLPAAAKNVTMDYFYASSWYSPLGTAACWRLGRSVDVSYLVQCHYESLTMSLLTCFFLVFASRNRCLLSPGKVCGCILLSTMSLWITYNVITYMFLPGVRISESLPAVASDELWMYDSYCNVILNYLHASSWCSRFGITDCCRLGGTVDISLLVQCHFELLTCLLLVFAFRNHWLLPPWKVCGCMIVSTMSL